MDGRENYQLTNEQLQKTPYIISPTKVYVVQKRKIHPRESCLIQLRHIKEFRSTLFSIKVLVSSEICLQFYYVSEKNLLPLQATSPKCCYRYCYPRKIAELNATKNSTMTSPPDKVTSEVITVSKEDLVPKNVPLKYNEELPTASEVSLDREEGVRTLGNC